MSSELALAREEMKAGPFLQCLSERGVWVVTPIMENNCHSC